MSLIGRDLKVSRKNFELSVEHFELHPGEIKAILGPSGSGKTTLLSVLGGLERPTQGTVELNGTPLTPAVMRAAISAVFQFPYLIKGTVEQNVSYGLKLRHTPLAERQALVSEMLGVVGLSGYEKRSVHMLSGGEQQRVALARALVLKPQVLLLDEPLSSLDANLKTHIAQEFATILRSQKMSAVYVTHDRHEAAIVADTLAVIMDGRIIAEMPINNLYQGSSDEQLRTFFDLPQPITGTFVRDLSSDDTSFALRLGEDLRPVVLSPEENESLGSTMEGELQVSIFAAPEDVVLFTDTESVPDVSRWLVLEGCVLSVATEGERTQVAVETALGIVHASVATHQCQVLGLAEQVRVQAALTSYHVEELND